MSAMCTTDEVGLYIMMLRLAVSEGEGGWGGRQIITQIQCTPTERPPSSRHSEARFDRFDRWGCPPNMHGVGRVAVGVVLASAQAQEACLAGTEDPSPALRVCWEVGRPRTDPGPISIHDTHATGISRQHSPAMLPPCRLLGSGGVCRSGRRLLRVRCVRVVSVSKRRR